MNQPVWDCLRSPAAGVVLRVQVHGGTVKVAAEWELPAPEPGQTGMGVVCGSS